MIESAFIALFLHHFAIPENARVERPARSAVYEGGVLTVQVESSEGRSFQPGSQRVAMLGLTLSASCENDISIESIALKRRGLGDRLDILSVYLLEGSRRLSSGRQPRRDGSVDLSLRNLIVPACGERKLMVAADFSASASIAGEHAFVLHSSDPIQSSAASLRFKQSFSALKPQRLAGQRQGSIAVSYPKLTKRVRYGAGQVVARVRLTADSKDDHRIHAITFTNEGTARSSDLQNLFVEVSPRRRATNIEASLSDDRVRLLFRPPLSLQKNQERVLTLRSDVRASRRKTIQFVIEEPGDIEAEIERGRRW